jgi:hypothetical protein
MARVYRLVDRMNERYAEKVVRSDGDVLYQSEPLSRHREHGISASVNDHRG